MSSDNPVAGGSPPETTTSRAYSLRFGVKRDVHDDVGDHGAQLAVSRIRSFVAAGCTGTTRMKTLGSEEWTAVPLPGEAPIEWNGKKEMAVVTRYGCGRVGFFEG
jgi:hypothetical protein